VVTDGDPLPTGPLARVGGVLLAEVRGVSKNATGNGASAVITGPGRGRLPDDFAPARMTRAEVERLLDVIRALDTPIQREIRIRADRCRTRPAESWLRRSGGGTGAVITGAVLSGALSWLDVLDDGWDIVVQDDARIGLLRPSYGSGGAPSSRESANAVGAVLTVHSSAVPWAEPQQTFSPPQALAASGYGGDYAEAMRAVEDVATAADANDDHRATSPFRQWPRTLMHEIHEQRQRSGTRWRTQQQGRWSDWAHDSGASPMGGKP
jgi:hypothetical protein